MRPKAKPVAVDVLVEAPAWLEALPAAERVVERAARATFDIATLPDDRDRECAILLADDARLRELNRGFRGQDKPTNVLAFPADRHDGDYRSEVQIVPADDEPLPWGDVAIAYGVTSREAAEQGKTLADHLSHLVVHGLLHLIGHDHEADEEALRMEALERRILWEIGVADPYAGEEAAAGP
jgi:probable rRNA maturation factor